MSYNSTESGVGGKMIRRKQPRLVSRTPYDRPPPVEKPNWLSTAGRVLVTGAGKLISSVIGSATSSSETDSASSDGEVDSRDGHIDTQVKFSSASKEKIVELIMLETFSRQESDALNQIIRSRTVDALMLSDNRDAQRNVLRDVAVIEARKWIDERKIREGSKSHLEYGGSSLCTPWAPQITKEAGSPIDVARTYMRVRPPWASPTANTSEVRSPTHVKIQRSTDGSSFPDVGVSSSQAKKRNLLASGSWSIAEEMRKVRARATDELLSTPSKKIDLSGFALNREANEDTIKHVQNERLAVSNSFTLALAAVAYKGVGPVPGAPMSTGSTALDTIVDVPQQEPLLFAPGAKMDQMADSLSTEGTKGGSVLHEYKNGVEDDIITSANDFQGMTSIARVATEPTADSPNIGNEDIPDRTNHATSEIQYNEEHTLDKYKAIPELLLPPQATKKAHRVKQAARVGRGRSRGK